MNWCWTDKFHSEQISNSFSSFKPSAHFKVLISNIHCSKIERNGLLWCACTRFTNQIEFLIWHICFLYTQNIDIFSTSSQFQMWNLKLMDLFQGCKGTRQNTTLWIWSAEGGQAGGSKKSVTPSFPKFWIAFLNTFWQKKTGALWSKNTIFSLLAQFCPLIIKNAVVERGRDWLPKVGLLRTHISTFFFNLAKIIRDKIVNEIELSFGEAPFFLKETFSRLRSNLHHYSFWVLSKMYNIPWKNI